MSEILIKSSPASMSTSVVWGSAGMTWTARTTKQIVSFELTSLGQNPVITHAELRATSTHEPADRFAVSAGGSNIAFSLSSPADVTSLIQGAAGAGTIDMTTEFIGTPPQERPDGISRQQNSVVTYTLAVTVEGEVSTDTRSNATLSASSVALGGSVTMTIVPINEETAALYSHRVTYALGSAQSTTEILPPGTTATSFTVPTNWDSQIPNGTSGTMTVTLDTLNGSASVGTRTYTVKVTVPNTTKYKPKAGTMSIAVINTGAMAGSSDYFAGASRMAVTLTGAAAGSGSSIASIVYTGWGESITTTATAIETNIIQTAGTVTVYATVTDGRGRSAQTSYTINVVQYNPPYFEEGIVVQRWSTAEQRSDMNGNAIRVNARFGCYTDVFPDNVASASVAYRVRGTESWSAETNLTSGVDAFLTPAGMDRMTAYELRFKVSDTVMTGENSVFYYYTLPSSQFVLHFGSSGRSVGIGQTAETPVAGEAGRVDINPEWNVYIGGEKLSMRDINETMSLIGSEMPALWYAIKSLQDQIDALRT